MGKVQNKQVQLVAGVKPSMLKAKYAHNSRYLKHIENCLSAITEASSTFVPVDDTQVNKLHFVAAVMSKCPTLKTIGSTKDVLRGAVKSAEILSLPKEVRCMLSLCYPTDKARLLREQEAETK